MKKISQAMFGSALALMTACGSESSFPEVTHIPCMTPSSSVNWSLIGVDGTLLCKDEITGSPSVVVNGVFSVTESPYERTISYYTAEKTPKRIHDAEYIDGGFCTEDLIPVVEKEQGITFIRKSGEEAFALNEYALGPGDETKHVQAVNAYFSDGLCLYKNEDGHYGYINTKGDIVIGEYAYANPFSEGLAVVGGKLEDESEDDLCFEVIDTKGKTVAKLDVAFNPDNVRPAVYSDGLLFFGGKVFNRKGEIAFRLSDKIEELYPFCHGYAIFMDEEMNYGLVNNNGEIVIRAGEYDNAYIAGERVYFADYDGQTVCFDFKGNRIFRSEHLIVPVGRDRCVLKSRKDCYFTDYDGESIDTDSYDNIVVPVDIYMPNLFLAYIDNDNADYVQWVKSDYYDAAGAVRSVLSTLTEEGIGAIHPGMSVMELRNYYDMGESSRHAYDYWNNFEGISGKGNLKTSYRVQFTEYMADYSEYNPDARVGHIIININANDVEVSDAGTRIREAVLSYLNQIGFELGGHNDDWMDEAWDIYRSDRHDYLIAINKDGSRLCLEAN